MLKTKTKKKHICKLLNAIAVISTVNVFCAIFRWLVATLRTVTLVAFANIGRLNEDILK